MLYERAYHNSFLLPDNRVFVSGSRIECEIYDPELDSWSETGSLILPVLNHKVIQVSEDRIILTGGDFPDWQIYDIKDFRCLHFENLSKEKYIPEIIQLNDGRILSAGGLEYIDILQQASPMCEIFTYSATDIEKESEFQNSISCYPNPLNSITNIKFVLNMQTKVEIDLYNILGERISTLMNEVKSPGEYQFPLNFTILSSGVYLLHFKTATHSKTIKLISIK